MAIQKHRIPKRIGTFTQRVKNEAISKQARAEETAILTLGLAEHAYGLRQLNVSWRGIARVLTQDPWRSKVGNVAVSPAWLIQLARRYEAGERSAADYMPKPRGPQPDFIAPKALDQARELVRLYAARVPLTHLLEELNEFILDERLGEEIGYEKFKRIARGVPREARVAGAFGSRMAELYASFHASVACLNTHDVWTLDAFDAPWRDRTWVPQHGVQVFVRPSVITAKDQKSGATVGYWISNPARRRDTKGQICTQGFDRDDLLAALLSAAIPALAPESTRPFAGHLPKSIRWDRHACNEELREMLRDVGERLKIAVDDFFGADEQPDVHTKLREKKDGTVEEITSLVDVLELPHVRPKNRGAVERDVDIYKEMCWHMDGHIDRHVPTSMWDGDQGHARSVGAASAAPKTVVVPLADDHWPMVEGTHREFDEIVRKRNHMVNRRTNTSPIARFHQFMPTHARRGDDILAVLEPFSAFVTGDGIELTNDHLSICYEPVIQETLQRFGLDAHVTGKVDPFRRCLFYRQDGKTYRFLPKDTFWATAGSAERAHAEERAMARANSDAAKEARRRAYDAKHGVGAADAALAEAEVKRRERVVQAKAERVAEARGESAPSGTSTMDSTPASPTGGVTRLPRDRRQRAAKNVDRSRAVAEKSAAHMARATGMIAAALAEPTTPPPPPVVTDAAAGVPPAPDGSTTLEVIPAAMPTPALPAPPRDRLAPDSTLDFDHQYRPRSPEAASD